MLPSFLKQIDDTVYFNGDGELIYYIPEKYFDNKNAVVIGEYVQTMGVFDYDVFEPNGKHRGLTNFYHPTRIKCKPTSIEKVSSYQIIKNTDPVPYRLLHFKKGAELVCSTRVPKGIANVEDFMKLLIYSNLPPTIDYNKLHEYIIRNGDLNGCNYKVSAQMFGIIVSELCRDKNDLSRPFRLTEMKDQKDYAPMNIKTLPKHLSPYIAITSENADESIANAIMDKHSANSPLEKVMMN